jgi:uncharacterized membrane protein YeaQ/YmgE (transglycosylase-associated protein family)
MLGFLIGLFFFGLIAGFIARLFVRSPRRLGCFGTAALGIVGSYAGGTLGAILFHQDFDLRRASTIVGAIVGTIIVLAVWRAVPGEKQGRPLRRR